MENTPVYTTVDTISCAGTNDVGGHPKVYLELKHNKSVVCPYCSRQFILRSE